MKIRASFFSVRNFSEKESEAMPVRFFMRFIDFGFYGKIKKIHVTSQQPRGLNGDFPKRQSQRKWRMSHAKSSIFNEISFFVSKSENCKEKKKTNWNPWFKNCGYWDDTSILSTFFIWTKPNRKYLDRPKSWNTDNSVIWILFLKNYRICVKVYLKEHAVVR